MEEAIDFTQEHWKRTIAGNVKDAIYAHLEGLSDSGYRTHLGASVIGAACLRSVYYHFRWFKRNTHSGRTEGIFRDGHEFETTMRAHMVAMGAQFLDEVDKSGEQTKFSAIRGHFGGSVDGIFIWPAMGFSDPTLLECKTSKTGAPFSDLERKQLIAAKSQHYVQTNIYMKAFKLKQALYICKNKNDWDLYTEIVELDNTTANEYYLKAEFVILDNALPDKISNKRNFFICNMCSYQSLCHDDEAPVPNCRNCKHSQAVEDAQFRCNKWDSLIPDEDAILAGCNNHEFRPY